MKTILRNWNLFRILRAAIGVFILIQGILNNDIFSMALGVIFGGMAVFNMGCCGAGGCTTDYSEKGESQTVEEVSFEEVKNVK